MSSPSDKTLTREKPVEVIADPGRLPDLLIDNDRSDLVDLPRMGVAKPVVNVVKGTARLPDVLIEN